jgi:alginate O-acetyltransferase complex protein AlgI
VLFTSLTFFLFAPVVVALAGVVPTRARWAWLLVASCAFYVFSAGSNVIVLAGVTLVAFACGHGIARTGSRGRRRLYLGAGLVAVLGPLIVFKFYDFLAGEIDALLVSRGLSATSALPRLGVRTPVGLSFYAFSVVSYLIDVYARRMPAESHVGRFSLFVAFFPKILAGPIERARTFLPQLDRCARLDWDRLVSGLQLIVWGLFKKVVIADNLAPFVDKGFGSPTYAPLIDVILAVYFFAFQIYCDFSGYTSIALGLSELLGLDLMENFRRPYLARSTSEFWAERWHLSLASWFRDYLYIPLGGSRTGAFRRAVNVMTVFVVSGLWHAGLGYGVGWTFLVWGALNGLYQWVGLATAPLWRWSAGRLPRIAGSRGLHVLRVLLTFHVIALAWIFFRAASLADALTVLRRIGSNLPLLPKLATQYPFSWEHAVAVALIALLLGLEILDERRSVLARLRTAPVLVRWTLYYATIFALLILGRWQMPQFIYMQF